MTDTSFLISTVRQWLTTANLGAMLRLPPERELADQFCVSRAEIRKALSVLEEEGQIRRHVGRGTFLVANPPEPAPTETDIAAFTSPLAAMQARFIIEPALAGLAALSASPAQINALRQMCVDMRKAPTWEAYAELDWRFHNMIAEATGNVLLVEFQRLLNDVRRYVLWGNLNKREHKPDENYHSFREHEALVDAIDGRDPQAATIAMRTHLAATRSHMNDVGFSPQLLMDA